MRVVAYKKGFDKPCIDYIENPSKFKIVGGFIRDDGYAVLQGSVRDRKSTVYVVPLGELPQSLGEALAARQAEAKKGLDMLSFTEEAIDKDILKLSNSALWAMGCDPEIY